MDMNEEKIIAQTFKNAVEIQDIDIEIEKIRNMLKQYEIALNNQAIQIKLLEARINDLEKENT